MNDIQCPYCGEGEEICHDDGYGYEEDKVFNQECGSCGKTFTYTTFISYYYEAEKAPCLNGEPHDWKPTATYPKFATRMNCKMCDEDRVPTPEEKITYKIPSYEEYVKENGQDTK